jgi:hypothetical protein
VIFYAAGRRFDSGGRLFSMSLRASATDHVYYDGVDVLTKRVVPWPPKYR